MVEALRRELLSSNWALLCGVLLWGGVMCTELLPGSE